MTYYNAEEYAEYQEQLAELFGADGQNSVYMSEVPDLPEEFDIETEFAEMLDDTQPKVQVFGCTWDASTALERLDPIAYRVYMSDYESSLLAYGTIVEVD